MLALLSIEAITESEGDLKLLCPHLEMIAQDARWFLKEQRSKHLGRAYLLMVIQLEGQEHPFPWQGTDCEKAKAQELDFSPPTAKSYDRPHPSPKGDWDITGWLKLMWSSLP